ncbi:MAG: ribosomal protein, partial [Methylobacterium brachiatum]|nr:ribosomal protein [Methylobacterium brachiatum]
VHLLDAGQLNTYDVLVHDDVVFTQEAYDQVVARLSAGSAEQSEKEDA